MQNNDIFVRNSWAMRKIVVVGFLPANGRVVNPLKTVRDGMFYDIMLFSRRGSP